jgi:hypothetical protein
MHDVDDEAGSPQTGFQDLRDPRLVLDDQKAHVSHSPDWPYGRRCKNPSYLADNPTTHAKFTTVLRQTASLRRALTNTADPVKIPACDGQTRWQHVRPRRVFSKAATFM